MPDFTSVVPLPLFLGQAGGGMDSMLYLLPVFFIIFYFILIRPQQRERKAQEAMRTNLKKGDEVLTQSGIIAKIQQVKDNHIILDLDGTARIRVLKESIARRLGDPSESKDKSGDKDKSAAVEASQQA